jgi:hypothetical protein
MAYNIPLGQAIHSQRAFVGGNMQNQPLFHQENLNEIENAWMENIDPLLRAQTLDTTLQLQQQQQHHQQQQQQQQQQPLQRFVNESERAFFTAGQIPNPARPQSFPRVNRPSEAIPSFPRATRTRMVSPSPSGASQDPYSQGSSSRSPAPEVDWVNEQFDDQQDEFSFPNASYLTQGLPELWDDRFRLQGHSYVNLTQVQGIPDLQDLQEVAFEGDESYMDMEMQSDYIEVDHPFFKPQGARRHTSYPHSNDEGLGASIQDGNSPQEPGEHGDVSDPDADNEAETFVAHPTSDTEYSPKSTRPRKRRASKASSSPAVKRGRTTKPVPKAAAKDSLNSTHARAFICVFGFAGCTSTFASKNEWKRHVSSQHLNLNSWVCELGPCGKVQNQSKKDGGDLVKGSEFNRKDLFTQHLRRMHAPFAVKRQNKTKPEWEERVKELQVSSLRVKRQPPTQLACPLGDCDALFEGYTCWDDRMEHVAKHLEKAAVSGGMDKFSVEQEDDNFLVNWALTECIIEPKAGGGYKLCGEKVEE